MYKVISSTQIDGEAVFSMATVGRSEKQNFSVAVNPSATYSGTCYLKYYNHKNYKKAAAVARLNLRVPEKVYHTNRDGKKEWQLNSSDRKNLMQFLTSHSMEFNFATYWQLVLYHWNNECDLLESQYPDAFSNHIEAFISGFYDTKENLSNIDYMPSYSICPDYTSVIN